MFLSLYKWNKVSFLHHSSKESSKVMRNCGRYRVKFNVSSLMIAIQHWPTTTITVIIVTLQQLSLSPKLEFSRKSTNRNKMESKTFFVQQQATPTEIHCFYIKKEALYKNTHKLPYFPQVLSPWWSFGRNFLKFRFSGHCSFSALESLKKDKYATLFSPYDLKSQDPATL